MIRFFLSGSVRIFIFAIIASYQWVSSAALLTEKEVIDSALKHYPAILESLQTLSASEQAVLSAEGAFDIKIKGDTDQRLQGFYDGESGKVKVVKPFAPLNAEIYGGMRASRGAYPEYERKAETLSQGEGFIGLSLSLLRDALIDLDRFNLRMTEQDLVQSQLMLDMQKVMTQALAMQAYWSWVVDGYELKVAEDLLTLAEDRVIGLNKRIRAGDLAKIYATENQKYILQRQALIETSRQDLAVSGFMLSLFLRDSEGNPKPVSANTLPILKLENYQQTLAESEVFERAKSRNLEIRMIDSKILQKQAKREMGRNDVLPKLNLTAEWSEDTGDGSQTFDGQESRLMLNFEVPIQIRKGRGKMRMADAEISALKTKRRFTIEKLRMKSKSLTRKLFTSERLIGLTKSQISLSEKLAAAERQKFRTGASDLILVNLRENALAETRIKNLKAILKWHFQEAELDLLTVNVRE